VSEEPDTPSESATEEDTPASPASSAGAGAGGIAKVIQRWLDGEQAVRWVTYVMLAFGVLVAFTVGRALGPGDDATAAPMVADEHSGHEAEPDPTVWTCSMHPQIRMSDPGDCPICGMALIEAEVESGAGDDDGKTRAKLSPRAAALARIKTEPVRRVEAASELRLLGRVDVDESRLRTVTPWITGRIDRLVVRETGTKIRKGQRLASLYSPDVYAAMRDLVSAAKQATRLEGGLHGSAGLAAQTLESARERLRLLGIPDGTIASVEKSKKPPRNVDIRATASGTVLKRGVEEGDYVKVGMPMFEIADLSSLWVQIDAYESDLPHLRVGQAVEVIVESFPDRPFLGTVDFIDPIVDRKTRTAQVRVGVENPDGELRPGMFAEAVIDAGGEAGLAHLSIPATAPLFTGRRSVVYVEDARAAPPSYELRVVKLGPRAGPVYPVLDGLSEGERVVTHGAFAIDADLQLKGKPSMMSAPDDTAPEAGTLALPPGFSDQLRPILDHYLAGQAALAADDAEQAKASLAALNTAVSKVEAVGRREVKDAWGAIASSVMGHTQHAQHAEDIGAMRVAFEAMTPAVKSMLQRFGNPTSTTVGVAFCPMAFDAKGAEWIQAHGDVANPYYGAAMLRCGEFRATVAPGEALAGAPLKIEAAGAAGGGHQH
jgi:Cu(I)/Ag(I) efflux system membrane fusion protein